MERVLAIGLGEATCMAGKCVCVKEEYTYVYVNFQLWGCAFMRKLGEAALP